MNLVKQYNKELLLEVFEIGRGPFGVAHVVSPLHSKQMTETTNVICSIIIVGESSVLSNCS